VNQEASAMTEAEWLECTDPLPMLHFLKDTDRASDRRDLLFNVACCRRIWRLFADERSRRAVEVAERFADGQATQKELEHAWQAAVCEETTAAVQTARSGHAAASAAVHAALAAHWAPFTRSRSPDPVCPPGGYVAGSAADAVLYAAYRGKDEPKALDRYWNQARKKPEPAQLAERAAQAVMLRCIYRNPFCKPPRLNPSLLDWEGGTIPWLAGRIYEGRRFDAVPLLGDILKEAGCRDNAILGHCQGDAGTHVRGCWVVDLLLGKE
jgi:hypothetical protein